MTTQESAVEVQHRNDGVAILLMDLPSRPVNVLRPELAEELKEELNALRADKTVKAVVFASGKAAGFIAGADISLLETVSRADEGTAISRLGQEMNDLLESFPKPIVAAIHGPCLGGGLELALACHGRVASNDRKTQLGLPEVQLGLIPGAGGTQRLPQLIGVRHALDLLLTGKRLPAPKALQLKLVDEVVPNAILRDVAASHALALAEESAGGTAPSARPRHSLASWLDPAELQEHALADNPLGRKVVFDQAKERVAEKTRGHYPAPTRILEAVRTGLAKGFERGLQLERAAFGELTVSREARSLIALFQATQTLRREQEDDRKHGKDAEEPTVSEAGTRGVHHVGVVGAGLMGAGVASVSAIHAGVTVRLKDRDQRGVLQGLSAVREQLDQRVRKRRLERREAERVMTQVTGTTTYAGFGRCDLVVEAVFEDLELKRKLVRELEEVVTKDAVIASNTSSLPITAIADGARNPDRILGMHYFSPVEKMPLLEVVNTPQTSARALRLATRLGLAQKKTVVVVRDGVGFYTTRVLSPYLSEAAHCVAEGVAIDAIDEALLDFGFPVGPLKLTDEVGLDVAGHVSEVMAAAFGDRLAAPAAMSRLRSKGRLGRKGGKGFYLYASDKKASQGPDPAVYRELEIEPARAPVGGQLAERCALLLVNEAARCFGDGIIRSARDGDVAAVLGLGFPPFLGGPFRYVADRGPQRIVDQLKKLTDQHGPRFAPAPVLSEIAREGRGFYGSGAVEPGRHGKPKTSLG